MKGKFADSITIRVGHGIMTIPRNITKSTSPKIVSGQKDTSKVRTSKKILSHDCD